MRQITSCSTADTVSGLFHHYRCLLEDVAHNRRNVGDDHDGEMTPAARMPIPKGRAGEQRADKRNVGKNIADRFSKVRSQQRREDKQPLHAVHDTGIAASSSSAMPLSGRAFSQPPGASSVKNRATNRPERRSAVRIKEVTSVL